MKGLVMVWPQVPACSSPSTLTLQLDYEFSKEMTVMGSGLQPNCGLS